jgi:hypothetical protein
MSSQGDTTPGKCSLGVNPVYAVNCSTDTSDVALTVSFAKRFNLRLIIKNTGHDQLGRSEGANGLEVWLRHVKQGLAFKPVYQPSPKCDKNKWTGGAFEIKAGYT